MNYSSILSLQFIHAYFSRGNEKPLRLVLTSDCERQMKYHSQVFRLNDQCLTILKDMEKIRGEGKGKLSENYFFDMAVFPSDSLFFIYSNFEANFRERISYYVGVSDSLKIANDPDKLNSFPFVLDVSIVGVNQANAGGDMFGAVPVVLKPEKFPVTVDASFGDHFVLVDKKNNGVNEWDMKDKRVEKASFFIDVSAANRGFLELKRNGAVVSRYFADDEFYKSRPPIILGMGVSLEQLKNAKNGSAYSRMECRVRFSNRPVYWNYHVIARGNGRKLENLEIVNNNQKMLPGVSFAQAGMDEGKSQVDFISDRPLPLIDKGYMDIELVDKDSPGSPLISNLPNADTGSIRVRKNQWISDIFVYI